LAPDAAEIAGTREFLTSCTASAVINRPLRVLPALKSLNIWRNINENNAWTYRDFVRDKSSDNNAKS